MVALAVDDVTGARRALEAKGIEFRGGILDSGVCHQAFYADPDGSPLRVAPPLRAQRCTASPAERA
jgi:hypothetical protein